MRLIRKLRWTTAVWLLGALCAFGTGLPSHSEHDRGPYHLSITSADDDAHGVLVIETEDRTTSTPQDVPAPPDVSFGLRLAEASRPAPGLDAPRPVRGGPPPGAPRAPPLAP
jgi:hypothetical protein